MLVELILKNENMKNANCSLFSIKRAIRIAFFVIYEKKRLKFAVKTLHSTAFLV